MLRRPPPPSAFISSFSSLFLYSPHTSRRLGADKKHQAAAGEYGSGSLRAPQAPPLAGDSAGVSSHVRGAVLSANGSKKSCWSTLGGYQAASPRCHTTFPIFCPINWISSSSCPLLPSFFRCCAPRACLSVKSSSRAAATLKCTFANRSKRFITFSVNLIFWLMSLECVCVQSNNLC